LYSVYNYFVCLRKVYEDMWHQIIVILCVLGSNFGESFVDEELQFVNPDWRIVCFSHQLAVPKFLIHID
jgi:hypothetical protein